ncbi:hypothetical protein LguiA_028871 [Lonicera macranthoides]
MDLTAPNNYFEPPPSLFPSNVEGSLEGNNGFYKMCKENPFADTFPDPLCKLNLKETSEFVKALPMANNNGKESRGFLEVSAQRRKDGDLVNSTVVTKRNNVEPPCTPGRPIFSFSTVGNNLTTRRQFPSKWDDAEKWLISGHDSPATHHHLNNINTNNGLRLLSESKALVFAEKSRVTEEKVSKPISSFQGDHHNNLPRAFNGVSVSASAADVLLKDEDLNTTHLDFMTADKFTNEVESSFPKFSCSETTKEGFLFGPSADKFTKDAATEVVYEVKHRDIGTEMTPLGSSTTSRCHTPFKCTSPARHNTPANRSGPLALTNSSSGSSTIDIAQLQECHLAKLQLGTQFDSVTSNWSSREEEEEEISKSLRHFEMSNECRKSVSDSRACAWEEEEKTKCCLRYQREEAKIQAWVNLQNAKAEAQMKKLEV